MLAVDALIAIAKSECPEQWSRYCDLATQLGYETADDCIRKRLAGNDRNRDGVLGDFYANLLGEPPSELQRATWEATKLERILRDRLIAEMHSRRYDVVGYGPDLKRITIDPELITAERLCFDRDNMQIGDTLVSDVRVVPAQALEVEPRGPKPGGDSVKDRVCREALDILNNDRERPGRGYGRRITLAGKVKKRLRLKHQEDTIRKHFAETVSEWEKKYPDK
jgi:hypothetical protein